MRFFSSSWMPQWTRKRTRELHIVGAWWEGEHWYDYRVAWSEGLRDLPAPIRGLLLHCLEVHRGSRKTTIHIQALCIEYHKGLLTQGQFHHALMSTVSDVRNMMRLCKKCHPKTWEEATFSQAAERLALAVHEVGGVGSALLARDVDLCAEVDALTSSVEDHLNEQGMLHSLCLECSPLAEEVTDLVPRLRTHARMVAHVTSE